MKRTIGSKNEESEDEIWNYKSTKHGPTQAKFKKRSRGHKLAEGDVANSSVKDYPASNQSVGYPVVDWKDKRGLSDSKRKTAASKGGNTPLQNTKLKCDFPNARTASDVSKPSLKSPCSQNLDSQHFVLTPPRMSTGNCPSCQVPFSALITDSPGWHALQCLEVSYNSPRPECSVGASCTNTILSHYQKYSHNLLALLRAGLDAGDSLATLDMMAQAGMTPSEICSQRNNATCSKRLNFDAKSYSSTNCSSPSKKLRQETGLNGMFCCGQQDDLQTLLSRQHRVADVTNPTPEIKINFDEENGEQNLGQIAHSVQCEHIILREFETSELRSTAESSLRENFIAEEDGDKISSENRPCSGRSSQSDVSELDMFCDLSDVLSDVFGDETLTSPQQASNKFSGIDKPRCQTSSVVLSSLRNVPNDDAVDKAGAGRGSQISAPSPRRYVHKKIPNSQLVCSSTKQTANLKHMKLGQNNNMQQLSINMFFKKVNGVSDNSVVPKDVLIQMKEQKVVQDVEPCKVLSEKQISGMHKHPVTTVKDTVDKQIWQSEVKAEYRASLAVKSGKVDTHLDLKDVTNNTVVSGHPDRSFRKCPFYKRIPNTSFCVDAFSYGSIPGCSAYFLSHFHSDHYMGLTKNFPYPIYCSKVTANLLLMKIRVKPHLVHALLLNEPQTIEGVEVTLLEANHCPGSVLLLFKLRNGQVVLHTGDFRADPFMEQFPQLQSIQVNQLFLDTTYCDPTYDFPSQKDVVQFAVDKTLDFMRRNPKMLVAVGTYSIGKERIFLALAEALDCEIFATRDKKNILSCLEDKSLNKRMASKAVNARLHVLKMNQINLNDLSMYFESLKPAFDHLLAFEPTGWTHSKRTLSLDNLRPKATSKNVTIYAVPYSEHSSYSEMKRFVQFLKPEKIIPTVNNGNPASRKKMEELFKAWRSSPSTQTVKTSNKQIQLNRWLENV